MENDGFFMNVNTNVSASAMKKGSAAKKLEKKNKYAEKRLMNKKRQRDPTKSNSLYPENELLEGNENLTNQNNNYTKKNFLDFSNQPNINNKANLDNNVSEETNKQNKTTDQNNSQNNKFDKNKNDNNKNIKNIDSQSQENTKILELNENSEKINQQENHNPASYQNQLDSYQFKEEPNDNLIDELNDFYSQQEKEQALKPKKLTSTEKQVHKQRVKTMQSEIENEKKEITDQAALGEEAKEKAIDYNSSVFSLKDFQDLDISLYLKRVLKKENLSIMTKIQKKAIPILLKHRDVVVKSETGSGKTLAYVIPVYDLLININIKNKIQRKDGVYVVVFAPTHELCLQIESTFDQFKSCCISAVFGSLMGGQSVETEKTRLRKGLNIIVTTPGRMLYHLNNTTTLNFSNLKMFVFDEADILLNMGFEKDIKECMRLIFNKYNTSVAENLCVKVGKNGKKDKDNLNDDGENIINKIVEKSEDLNSEYFKKFKIFLISATIDNKIRQMADFLMKGFKTVGFEMKKDGKDPKNKKTNKNELKDEEEQMMEIIEEDDNETFSAPANLVQEYSIVFDEFRLIHLLCQIYNNVNKKLIVFVSCCDTVNFLQEFLTNFKFNLEHVIHEGEVGVGFNKYKNREDSNANNKNKKSFGNNGVKQNKGENEAKEGGNAGETDSAKKIKLINSPILKLHGKMTHEERKKIFKEFNQDKPGNYF
jgi:superfamily II DNA/RNA helicase